MLKRRQGRLLVGYTLGMVADNNITLGDLLCR